MSDELIGRQPIFDAKKNVFAYELLYRSADADPSSVDGDAKTTQVILNAFTNIGLDSLVQKHRAFINLTRAFLLGDIPIPFPPQRTVLEVLEDIPVDQRLVEALKSFRAQGYQIALDDVTSLQRIYPLLGLTNYVKIDLMAMDRRYLEQVVNYLHQCGVKVLAEKVETQEDFDTCLRLGCEYFQGFFLCKPNVLRSRRVESSRLVVMRTLATLEDPHVDFDRMEEVVAQDASLSYKMLTLVNSAYYNSTAEVKSLRQAVAMIGLSQLKVWILLLLVSKMNDKPHELTTIAMTRAKMAELIARALNKHQTEPYFLAGLLSVMDAMMDQPMQEALGKLPLAHEVQDALVGRGGHLGKVLQAIEAYEVAEWSTALALGLEQSVLRDIYLQAIQWADRLSASLLAPPAKKGV